MTRLRLLEQLGADPPPKRPARIGMLATFIVVALIAIVAFPMPGWILARAALLGAVLSGFFIARPWPINLVGFCIASFAMGLLSDTIDRRTFLPDGILGREHWRIEATLVMWATVGALVLISLAVGRRGKARIDPSASPSSQ